MKIKKYPITSKEGNEYLVTIKSKTEVGATDFFDSWHVKLYKKDSKCFWFNIPLYSWSSGRGEFEDYLGKYKLMAELVVNRYECQLKRKQKRDNQYLTGLEEFETWDGKVK